MHTPNDYLPEQYARFAHIADEKRRQRLAMVASLDAEIGRILNALDRKGLTDDTLVWFLCDNGGNIPGGASNLPLRDGKWAVYEGGIRLASALRWPNGLDGGRKLTEPVGYIDVFPTLMRVAGASGHDGQPFDGEGRLGRDSRRENPRRLGFSFVFPGAAHPQNSEPGRKVKFERNAVNSRRWKLVRLGPDMRKTANPRTDATLELYRIDEDISERRNLARSIPTSSKTCCGG